MTCALNIGRSRGLWPYYQAGHPRAVGRHRPRPAAVAGNHGDVVLERPVRDPITNGGDFGGGDVVAVHSDTIGYRIIDALRAPDSPSPEGANQEPAPSGPFRSYSGPPRGIPSCRSRWQAALSAWRLGADRRPSCPVQVGPVAADQAAVPAQYGAGGDQPVHPQLCGHEPGERREDCLVGPVQPGPRSGTAQNHDLVPQREQLGVLRCR